MFRLRSIHYITICLLLVCSYHPTIIAGQAPYTVEYLGKAEGLPSQKIRAVTQDKQGLMWFAAYGTGIIRFDGWKYEIFDTGPHSTPRLSSSMVLDIIVDKRGLLWVANDNGIDVVDPVSMHATAIQLPMISFSKLNYIYSLYADPDGDIWATNFQGGLIRFPDANPSAGILVEKSPAMRYVNRATDGHLWYFKNEGLILMRQDGNDFKKIDLPPGCIGNNRINPVENDAGLLTGISVITPKNKVKYYRIDPNSSRFVPGTDSSSITFNDLKDFIYRFPEKFASPIKYAELDGKDIKTFRDRQGLIWVSTAACGVFKLKLRDLIFTTCPDLKDVSMRGMLERPDGCIYISSYSGLYLFSPHTNRAHLISDKWNTIFHLAEHYSNSMLAFSEGGSISLLNLQTLAASPFNPLPTMTGDECYYASMKNSDGSVLAGNRCLFRINPADRSVRGCGILPTNYPIRTYAFKRSKSGLIWIGTNEGVFTATDEGICDTPALRKDYRLGAKSQINDIFEDNAGRLWFATRQYGLIRFDAQTQEIRAFDKNNGFSSNETYSILSSHDGNLLWVSTCLGIHVIQLKNDEIRIFDELDGTSNNEFNTGSSLQKKSGEIYFGGLNGLTRFCPDSLYWHKLDIAVPFIQTIDIEDKGTGNRYYLNYPSRDTLIHLLPDQSTLDFHFGSGDYFRTNTNTFYVQLVGLDRDWVAIGSSPHIKYYSLPAGHYTFRVKCTKDASASGTLIYSVSFEIENVFYKKWWFAFLLATLAFLAASLVFRLRLIQFKREQDLRHRIAGDLHDSLGGKLSSISNMVHLINRLNQEGKPSGTESQKLLEITQSVHGAISDIIWAVDNTQQELSSLIRRMEDYADRWLRAAKIKVVFESTVLHPDKKIPFFLKHQLLLVYKEILGNALKHTFPEHMVVRFEAGKESIYFLVETFFTERKVDAPSTGRGIQGIEERMQRIGGSLHIQEEENIFRVWVQIPGK